MFTEQLIPSNQSLFHLVLGLQSVQMLEEVHFRQFSSHFLHTFASVGERKDSGTQSSDAKPDTALDSRRSPVSWVLPWSR